MTPALDNRIAVLRQFVAKANLSTIPPEIASEMFKLGAVLICGNIERCVELVILDRLSNRAHPKVISFIKSYFKRGTNYDCEEIEQLLARFDSEWSTRFREYMKNNDAIREAVSSCYAIRNSVAHGGTQTVGGARLKVLSEHSVSLIQALVESTA